MRDRLEHLQATSESNGTVEAQALHFSDKTEQDDPPLQDLRTDPDLESVFDEAQEARREIQLIRLEVKNLREQNSRIFKEAMLTTTTDTSDSNAIAADIKTRGQEMLAQIRKMDFHAKDLEDKYGVNSPVARIARAQYTSVSTSFRDAMVEYNDAEMSHRESCKSYIQRQMEIVGREVTGDQIEDMLESGHWNVFSENMVPEGKTARSALVQIESRHTELLQLERRIQSLHEVFMDVAMLAEEQRSMVDCIHTHVKSTEVEVRDVLVKLERAKRHDRSNPFKKMFFWKR